MQEIILKRLGAFYAPHWIQLKYFDSLGEKDLIVLDKTTIELPEVDYSKYLKNTKFNVRVHGKRYLHYKRVLKPDPHESGYEYVSRRDFSLISEFEKDFYFLEDKELDEKFRNCFKEKMDIEYEEGARTNPTYIQWIKEYQKEFPEGDGESFYGKWCWNVVSIPDDVVWEIDEPEGCNEIIREVHRVWAFNGDLIEKGKQK